jgi:hypothetical protein
MVWWQPPLDRVMARTRSHNFFVNDSILDIVGTEFAAFHAWHVVAEL